MKKSVSVLLMTALLLTGCGNAAGTAESSAPAANAVSADAKSGKEDSSEAEVKETQFENWYGIDMPIPGEMEESVLAKKQYVECWEGGAQSDLVFYSFDQVYNQSEYLDESQGHTVEELPELEALEDRIIEKFNAVCQCAGRITVDSTAKETFMGHEVLCVNGTAVPSLDDPIHIKIYYGYLDNTAKEGYKHIPSCWYAFTQSNSKEALDLMNKAADLPLTEAKLHENDD